jgi:Flp pilus assembly protein TadB
VPLSEHEQRQLEAIEQALYRQDRRLRRFVRSSDPRVHYRRRVVQAASGFVIGAGMVAAGVVLSQSWHLWLAIAGFIIMLLCGVWGLSSWRHMAGVTVGGAGVPVTRRKRRDARRGGMGRATMMERFEERWRRRREGR